MWTKSLSLRNKNNIAERLDLQSLLSFNHSSKQREMAYAALSSLIYTLEQLVKPNQSLVCPCSTQQHHQSLYQNLSALQLFLDNTLTKDIGTLKLVEKRIKNVVYKAEDKVDSSLRSIILTDCTESREGACKFFEEELLKVEKDVDSHRKEVMVVEFNKHGSKSTELATTSFSPEKGTIEENSIVGMEDDFNTILDRLTAQTDELTVIPIFGMGGTGKTTSTPYLIASLPKQTS
ncbi:hypothetical protein R3W88_028988 [Solanum pinnatisectum]|uniref:Uncharacterized protein n=1 Tax=Solanum pinnatisectum TaxID=50273 RepID=A0AAV9K4H1_9SOLN|nr:hypothetical protein R3W88_028988 [Solanum pinnatisectum]